MTHPFWASIIGRGESKKIKIMSRPASRQFTQTIPVSSFVFQPHFLMLSLSASKRMTTKTGKIPQTSRAFGKTMRIAAAAPR